MTMNLITGKAGAPHITSSDQGAMQAGLVGNGNYLLQGSDGKFPAVTMQSANKALIPVLNLVIEGRYARVTAAETVTIESGVTGRNRNDLICVKYTRDSNNIETIALAVLKGTATSGTAADPTVPSGSILNNSGTVWIPIARIPISGITAGTPVMLVKQLPPMSQLWDSVPTDAYHLAAVARTSTVSPHPPRTSRPKPSSPETIRCRHAMCLLEWSRHTTCGRKPCFPRRTENDSASVLHRNCLRTR